MVDVTRRWLALRIALSIGMFRSSTSLLSLLVSSSHFRMLRSSTSLLGLFFMLLGGGIGCGTCVCIDPKSLLRQRIIWNNLPFPLKHSPDVFSPHTNIDGSILDVVWYELSVT